MKVIGLLGGIGAGKSTVAGRLRELGASVFDADLAVHEAWRQDEVKASAAALLGNGILGPDGEVDRARVAELVFQDPARLKALEALLHPRVADRREGWMKTERLKGTPALVLDVPLLVEAGMDRDCDLLLFVEAPESLREARKNWGPGELARRQALQGDLGAKRARAHTVITNAGKLSETLSQVDLFWKRHILPQKEGGDR